MITIRVNGRELPATEGANLLEVLQSADTRIPAVCFHPALKSATSICRLCTVEVAHERTVDHHPDVKDHHRFCPECAKRLSPRVSGTLTRRY